MENRAAPQDARPSSPGKAYSGPASAKSACRVPISVCASKEDPTIAELLKAQGYATGQFGKNHLGDKDEMLPTAHGFDEFYGNLYHLNAEEEPELPDYPKPNDPEFPNFRKNFGPSSLSGLTDDSDIR